MKKSIPLIAFIIVSILDLIGIYLSIDILIYVAKPLLMITLFWYYYMNARILNKLFIVGLAFSFLGDVFLLGDGMGMFIAGLISFLLAHIFYIILLIKWLKRPTLIQIIMASIPYLIIFFLLMIILYDGLGEMRIPVIIYAMTISLFGMISLIHLLQVRSWNSFILVSGVLVFILSDSLLALNLFYIPKSFYPIMIMVSYVFAQYLICRFVLVKIVSE